MPFASRRSSRLLPSTPSTQKLTLPGRRFSRSPLRKLYGIFESPAISLSRSAVMVRPRSSIPDTASSRAAAIPAIAGRFSVPARRPFSCAPPEISVYGRIPRRTYSTPMPRGPWNLCADIESISILSRWTFIGSCPAA